jgi:deoxyribonucleoside regulator
MSTKFDVSLMVKVAQMYYNDGMKQEEIAGSLSISRSLISMILTEAKEAGIIQIIVRDPLKNNDELADRFKKGFNLKNCVIIPTSVQDADTLRRLVVQRTIEVFNNEVETGTVGLAWGRTCYQFVDSYKSNKLKRGFEIVSLIGGSNQTAEYFQLNEMVRLFAEKLNGIPHFIHAPVLAASNEEKELFMNSSAMKDVREKWESLDALVCSVGTPPSENRERYIGEFEIFKKDKNFAIGDMCARYFSINGEFVINEDYDRVISIPVECLKKAKKIICMASGFEKLSAIVGALRTGIVDIFICDEPTAKKVLDLVDIEKT